MTGSARIGLGGSRRFDDRRYCNLLTQVIGEPAKVTRSALENAASAATMILTTETLVTEIPEKTPAPAAPPMPEY